MTTPSTHTFPVMALGSSAHPTPSSRACRTEHGVARRRTAPLVAVVAGLLVALVGCGSSTAGSPSAAATSAPATSASATAAAAATTAAATSEQAAPTLASKDRPVGKVACPAGAIAPAGAVYCYTTPSGFVDITKTVTLEKQVGTSSFMTAVAPSSDVKRDAISVQQFPLSVDAGTLSDSDLSTAFGETIKQFAQTSGTTVVPANPATIRVDDATTLVYEQTGSGYSAHQYFTFRGKNEVQVSCQYKDRQADIERGCTAVLQSLQVAS